MICNKKAYPDLKKDCETCSERDDCFSSHAVGVAMAEPILQSSAASALRETMQINVGGVMTTAYRDEIEKEIYRALHEPLMLNYGA